jgi:hypothetical protein
MAALAAMIVLMSRSALLNPPARKLFFHLDPGVPRPQLGHLRSSALTSLRHPGQSRALFRESFPFTMDILWLSRGQTVFHLAI